MNIGFTIGKFAPLHLGHDELIKRGIKENDLFKNCFLYPYL